MSSTKGIVSIKIKYFSLLRDLVGKKAEDILLPQGTSVSSLLAQLKDRYGDEFKEYVYDEDGSIRQNLTILVNGVNTNDHVNINRELSDKDEVVILPALGGGN